MPVHKAGVKIQYRRSWWSGLAQIIHYGIVGSLMLVLIIGSIRYISVGRRAGALDYTTHIMGIDTSAVGVLGVAAADVDDDGDIDVVTAGKDGLKVYEQTSDSVFEAKIIDDKDSERVQIIDLDNDGVLDLLVTITDRQPSVRWYKNNGSLEFSGTNIGTGTSGEAFAGDIDADGSPDIITATTQSSLVVLQRWMNDGTGSFTATQLSADSGVTSIGIGDISGNGYPDIITGGSKGVQRWGTSDGFTFSRLDIDDSNTGQQHIVVADVNKDNKLDVVAAEPGGNQVVYYRNIDQSVFDRIAIGESMDATTVQVVDLDEDGDEDVLVAAQDDNSIVWLSNDGSDSFTKKTIASGLQSIFGLTAVDIDNDNDFDFVGGSHMRGTVYWYERIVAKPVATSPENIVQSSSGDGQVTFETTISDVDYDATRIRIQYSLDGSTWYKPWLTSVAASSGSVNLKNSHGYQVGTTNSIDTDDNESVKLTLEWDTTSVENTGGPISGEASAVRLRIIPRDGVGNGDAVESSTFVVDNQAPVISGFAVDSFSATSAETSWNTISDTSDVEIKIHYGTNAASVLSEDSDSWSSSDDATLSDATTVGTTLIGLTNDTFYTLKLYVTDAFGNKAGLPSVSGVTADTVQASPSATPTLRVSPTSTPSPVISPITTTTTTPTLTPTPVTPSPSLIASPTSTVPTPIEPAINLPPLSYAGKDLVVNSEALVILDGTGSKDPEGSILTYQWRQVVGPSVELSSSNTATPSFTAAHEDESYVFSLTVRDVGGLVETDSVTVITRPLLGKVINRLDGGEEGEVDQLSMISKFLLIPANTIMFILSIIITVISVQSKLPQAILDKVSKLLSRWSKKDRRDGVHVLRTVDSFSGERMPSIDIEINTMNGKLWRKIRTDEEGEVKLSLPVGQYTLVLKERGYDFAPAGAVVAVQKEDIIYGGGRLQVKRQDQPMLIIIPLRNSAHELSSMLSRLLRVWQALQRRGHILAWPIYIAGAGLNTALLLWMPNMYYLFIEIFYIALVIFKVWMEVSQAPSYGHVRDAISHVPLDLAVVRLYKKGTNELVVTRATNAQGRFFILPPPGDYTITVSKPGYATFTKQNISIKKAQNASIQIKTDLMPVVPEIQPQLATLGISN
jgi:hypothetical protein